MKRFSSLFSTLFLVWLVACSVQTDPLPPPPSATGTISGTILGTGASPRVHEVPPGAEYVPGEVIVAFMDDEPTTVRVAGVELQSIRTLDLPGTNLLSTGGQDPAEVAAYLNTLPEVRYAQPNYILRPLAFSEPNDPIWHEYPQYFWNYDAIDVMGAWSSVTGTDQIVVAVIDSGIVVDTAGNGRPSHPDLVDSVLPGYDFISNRTAAADGDGRDDDPYDPGGNPSGEPRYHGTHVAGTIGASTNNGIGIPGVGWDVRILPVRALGHGGGTLLDIMDGAMWAAGISVSGVPDNPYPADVLNMSLGAASICDPYTVAALERIRDETKAIPVVAAGNKGVDVIGTTPANCPHVITVAASGYIPGEASGANLAWYSNYGNRIDITAPGGDMRVNDAEGILSTWVNWEDGNPIGPNGAVYGWSQGTSMAAPHVAGVVALMKAVDRSLTTEQVRVILRNTATPLSCSKPCGAGLINASAAVQSIQMPGTGPSGVVVSPTFLDFWTDQKHLEVEIANNGSNTVTMNVYISPNAGTPPGWLSGPTSITVVPGGSEIVTFTAHRDVLTQNGSYSGEIHFMDQANGNLLGVVYTYVDKRGVQTGPQGRMHLVSWVPDPLAPDGMADSAHHTEPMPFSVYYGVPALTGENIVAAFVDIDGSGDLSSGDWVGWLDGTVRVRPSHNTTVPAFYISPYTGDTTHFLVSEERLRTAIRNAIEQEQQ